MDFKTMMAKRKDRLTRVQSQLEKESTKGNSYEDNRFWRLESKDGNGSAIIRFLPEAKDDEIMWAKYYRHEFKGTQGWLIDNCPTSIGEKCPVCEANNQLWNEGGSENEELARSRKRRLKYISNIYVVQDTVNPDNEGKVFLFQYGAKIFEFIDKKINPPEPEFKDMAPEEPVDVFDFFEGCNFRLRMRKKAGYVNYDMSTFDEPSAISEDEAEVEEIWNSQHSLKEFISPDYYKSYDELKERFEKVSGQATSAPEKTESKLTVDEDEDEMEEIRPKSNRVTKPSKPKAKPSNDDDELSFFEGLAEA